jgi:peroxisomal enoyl-CoA hydratase 2
VVDLCVDKSFGPLPTYPVVLNLKGDTQELNLFAQRAKSEPAPGMPPMDPNRVVRACQYVHLALHQQSRLHII